MDFVCDFEDPDVCGWQDQSLEKAYSWERRQRGDTLPDSGPSSDFTIGTATGTLSTVLQHTDRDSVHSDTHTPALPVNVH